MRYVTERINEDGELRRYFRRRGIPVLRLYGDMTDQGFLEQYAFARALVPRGEVWPRAEVISIQRILSAMKPRTAEDIKRHVASRLSRSVNSRAIHQYRVPCEIDTAWVLRAIERQGGRCAVSGLPFSYERGLPTKDGRNPMAPSVDRIDNAKGYEKNNCRLVILAVNVALNLWGDDMFLRICRATLEKASEQPPCNVVLA